VERTSHYGFLYQIPDATILRNAFTRKLKSLPAPLLKSLTYDQRQ
jgi:IS30 family transposase